MDHGRNGSHNSKLIHTSSLGLLIGKQLTTLIDDHHDHLLQSPPSHKMKMLKTWGFDEDGLGGISKINGGTGE